MSQNALLHETELPDGIFYDGRLYVGVDGYRSTEHPGLAAAIDEELARRNASVDESNAEVKALLAEAEREAAAYLSSVQA